MIKFIYITLGVFVIAWVVPAFADSNMTAGIEVGGWQLQDIVKAKQTGEEVSKQGFKPTDWYKATVPGTVLTSLVNDGVYPDPMYGENNRPDKIPDTLCRTAYWYHTEMIIPTDYANKQVWLNFEGINYTADLFVNGQKMDKQMQGAFARGYYNVTKFVTPGQPAGIAVRINPPPHPGDPHQHTQDAGTGGNGGLFTEDSPTFICTLGWDWIPGIHDRDMGIWARVWLNSTGPVVIQNPYITTDLPLPRTDSADVKVEATVTNVTDTQVAGTLIGQFANVPFSGSIVLNPNESKVLRFTPDNAPTLHVINPKLWWPNGYGDPNLYSMHLSFIVNGTTSDQQDVTFGIRKIVATTPNNPVDGNPLLNLSVNGVPVMVKGGAWGMDDAMKRIPQKNLDAKVRFHQLANYNMIRNWVGQSTGEGFYEACDKYGIMLWDEFFEPNDSDGPRPLDQLNVPMYMANVREKVLRYRNHPSIAVWCGRNESDPTPEAVATGITKTIDELDPQRFYLPNSGAGPGVRSGGPYHWQAPEDFYQLNTTQGFKTELGDVSIPTLQFVHDWMPQKDWESLNDDWAEHDLARGAQSGNIYPATIATHFGRLVNVNDFIRKSQLANYESYRAMYEGRDKYMFQGNTGTITWMSNPSQPSFVWQIYSYDNEPMSSLYAVQSACEPIHIQMNQDDYHLTVVNNTPDPLVGYTARVRTFNLDGTQKSDKSVSKSLAPSWANDLGEIEFPADLTQTHFVKVELFDWQNKLISDGLYWRNSNPDNRNNYVALDTLPVASIDAKCTRHDANGKCLIDVTITNSSKNVSLITHVQLQKGTTKKRVLPVFYSHNYISLLPGESKSLTVEADSSDVGNETPMLALDGFNATTTSQTFGTGATEVLWGLNTDSQVESAPPSMFGGLFSTSLKGK